MVMFSKFCKDIINYFMCFFLKIFNIFKKKIGFIDVYWKIFFLKFFFIFIYIVIFFIIWYFFFFIYKFSFVEHIPFLIKGLFYPSYKNSNELFFFFFPLNFNIFFFLTVIWDFKIDFLLIWLSSINLFFSENLIFYDLFFYKYKLFFFYKFTNFLNYNYINFYLIFFLKYYFNKIFFFLFLKNFMFLNLHDLPFFYYFALLFIFSTISSFFLISYLGLYGIFVYNFITIFLFWISLIMFFNFFFIDNKFYIIDLGKWFILPNYEIIKFEFYIDVISYSFMFLTVSIAVFVYIYTFSYFRYEPKVEYLILFINCFVISMIILVISGNLFILFFGWELIGLTSFLLINFWSTRIFTLKSAFKAFTFNKYSDLSILLSILLIFFSTNIHNILILKKQICLYNNFYIIIFNFEIPLLELISFFFSFAAFVKSAQFGFHIWLPDSMEAPVPASALIHSATLVSAGLFLLLKFNFLFEQSNYIYYIIPFLGSFTAAFGGLCASYQTDVKKVLAYSTISHCGFLMIVYSSNIIEYVIIYLYVHGFFKASAFLCIGNIIRFSNNLQDFRKMGLYWKYLPFECICSFICLINLCGLPFSLGFYSKHFLMLSIEFNDFYKYIIFINILLGSIFGLIYSYKLFYFIFFDFKKAKKRTYYIVNRKVFFSKYYSNTTLISIISIICLIIFSYCCCFYLFYIFNSKSSIGDGLNIYTINSSKYEEFNYPIFSILINMGYVSWLLILFIFIIILSSWRIFYNFYKILDYLQCIYIFSIFYFFFYIIFENFFL